MADAHTTPSGTAGKYIVYGLHDPRTDALRYIGQTKSSVRQRLAGHLCDARRRGHTHIARWLAALGRLGLRPVVRVLERCSSADAVCDLERKWIEVARNRGDDLTNVTDGGEGAPGFKHSAETLIKFRARPNVWSGRKHTEESKRLMSDALKRVWTAKPELRVAQSLRHKGKKISAETRKKYSAHAKQNWLDPEYRQKQIAGQSSERTKDGHRRQALAVTGRRRSLSAIAVVAAKNRQPVVDQFGTIYASMNDAGKALGVLPSNVSAVVNGHRPHTRGYKFRLVAEEASCPINTPDTSRG